MVIYFGKVNLVSQHIYKVYDKELDMRDIMLNILINFSNDLKYQEENTYMGEDGETHTNTIDYSIYIREKQIPIYAEE